MSLNQSINSFTDMDPKGVRTLNLAMQRKLVFCRFFLYITLFSVISLSVQQKDGPVQQNDDSVQQNDGSVPLDVQNNSNQEATNKLQDGGTEVPSGSSDEMVENYTILSTTVSSTFDEEDIVLSSEAVSRSLEELFQFYIRKNLTADKDKANDILILEGGDSFTVLETDIETGCMSFTEADIPKYLNGTQSYRQDCDPNAKVNTDPSMKCKLYTKSRASRDPRSDDCIKPTHLICDPTIKQCACGNEGIVISEIRFQFGNYEGKNQTGGRCFIRPTFDFIPGIECSPGTKRKELAVEEEAESIPICACESDSDFDKFDSKDQDWWKCGSDFLFFGKASYSQPYSTWNLGFMIIHGVLLSVFQ